mmetsp:Transcript_50570/g.120612  ORF Transcript_50570/g.120612 Transcript_50570/m.120612 type:complete len:210 (-) Transcript_50570:876-1505(-)
MTSSLRHSSSSPSASGPLCCCPSTSRTPSDFPELSSTPVPAVGGACPICGAALQLAVGLHRPTPPRPAPPRPQPLPFRRPIRGRGSLVTLHLPWPRRLCRLPLPPPPSRTQSPPRLTPRLHPARRTSARANQDTLGASHHPLAASSCNVAPGEHHMSAQCSPAPCPRPISQPSALRRLNLHGTDLPPRDLQKKGQHLGAWRPGAWHCES